MADRSGSYRLLLIPAVVGLAFAGLSFVPAWKAMDKALYDLFLRVSPPIAEDKSLVLLNVDDEAITREGTWPWPRGLFAEGLEVLTEFNAGAAVFDIEYLEKSPMSVDQRYLNETLKGRFTQDIQDIQSSVYDLLTAVSQGTIGRKDIAGYTTDLTDQVGQIGEGLYQASREVVVENDSYLGQAMRLFGHAYVTLNVLPSVLETTPAPLRTLAQTRFPYPDVENPQNGWSANRDFLVPIPEISGMAAAAGFTNVPIDADGTRRRIRLVETIAGKSYLQLAFRPLVDRLGHPKIVLEPGAVVLRGAVLDGRQQDIRIPVDEKGYMLIHWPQKKFKDSFAPHVSFYRLLEYRQNEQDEVGALKSLEAKAVWDLVPGKNPVAPVLEAWDGAEAARHRALESGTHTDRSAYLTAKAEFYGALGRFTASTLDAEALAALRRAKANDTAANGPLYDDLDASLQKAFAFLRSQAQTLDQERATLRAKLEGATCFIGWTAIASTDFGVNPFDEQYANVGTHAALTNTVVQKRFLAEAPFWVSPVLTLVLALGLIAAVRRMRTGAQILVGAGGTVGVFVVLFLLFAWTGIYVPAMAPLWALALSFLFFILAVFFLTEKEKSFLRKAFSTYLSSDVIEQIVLDPALLKLGGQKKWISAMFTDVKGFSTISEKLDPEDLVALLNLYLSAMSDIILENRGTIDKFEGDAIISFFGAPVSYPNHAEAICRSALLMKRTEGKLNERVVAENLSPTPLLTRIGINTGDMVVGNMGTEKKMDYTIMGNAVNLAARLEGVNKQYGTWILTTGVTKAEAGTSFAWRRLDRVRVVGIHTPQQLYELVDFALGPDDPRQKLLADFEAALTVFEARRWDEAEAAFGALVEAFPDDGPSKVYLKRCRDFQTNPPAAGWEGVFNLTEK